MSRSNQPMTWEGYEIIGMAILNYDVSITFLGSSMKECITRARELVAAGTHHLVLKPGGVLALIED